MRNQKNTMKMIRLKMCVLLLFLMPLFMTIAQEKKVIIIDAGHGGKDSGALCRFGTEAKINLSIANQCWIISMICI